jgi:hypothetical protein
MQPWMLHCMLQHQHPHPAQQPDKHCTCVLSCTQSHLHARVLAMLCPQLRSGVSLSLVSLPFSLLDDTSLPELSAARSAGLTVIAEGSLGHGLICSTLLGAAQPPSGQAWPGADSPAAAAIALAR